MSEEKAPEVTFDDDDFEERGSAKENNGAVDDDSIKSKQQIDNIPSINSPDWNDYLLKQFASHEVDGCNHPKLTGLRRLAEMYIGEVIASEISVIQVPTPENNMRATVVSTIKFLTLSDRDSTNEPLVKIYSEAADAYPDNTDDKVSKYPVSVAASRAEGRALRKALKMTVITSEEAASKDANTLDVVPEFIDNSQKSFLTMMCKRNNINVMKFINSRRFIKDGESTFDNLDKIPYEKAKLMAQTLTDIQRKAIPEEKLVNIRGYDENWSKA